VADGEGSFDSTSVPSAWRESGVLDPVFAVQGATHATEEGGVYAFSGQLVGTQATVEVAGTATLSGDVLRTVEHAQNRPDGQYLCAA
jgi:hypothetical protein